MALEPVTGRVFASNEALGAYLALPPTPFLAPRLNQLLKLPLYAVVTTREVDAEAADNLASSIKAIVLQRSAVATITALAAAGVALLAAVLYAKARQRPELKSTQVKPVDQMEREARIKTEAQLKPSLDSLRDVKDRYNLAVERLAQERARLLYQKTEDARALVTGSDKRRCRSGDKAGNVYAIAATGEVFSFKKEELLLLVEEFGNPLAGVAHH
jgi:hypothetical protein